MENEKLILEALAKMSKQIADLASKKTETILEPHRSEEVKELFTALAKAQGEFKVAGLTKENPYFKSRYADLAEMVRVSRPALTKHGLSVVQKIVPDQDGSRILHTVLQHNSGQWTDSKVKIVPPKSDVQSYGSYKSYQKRYEYGSLTGVVCADEDDDGEAAVHEERKSFNKGTKLNHKYNPKEQSFETITKEQLEEIRYELKSHTDLAEEIMDKMKIQSLSDMPESKFLPAIRRIREIVQARDGN
jgi:hypothetical protein